MMLPEPVKAVRPTDKFKAEYRRQPQVIQQAIDAALRNLVSDPVPESLGITPLTGSSNPNVYTFRPTWNEPYLVSFEMQKQVAILRSVIFHDPV